MLPAIPARPRPARAGVALLTALGVLVLVIGLVLATTTGAMVVFNEVRSTDDAITCQGALEAVLARRQQQVINLVSNGKPEDFINWTDNYGVDMVGPVEVRWKVEPTYTAPAANVGFVQNPKPGSGADQLPNELANNNEFCLYQVSAEARLPKADGMHTRVQGVRYVVTPNESALNYLIYYAQRGAKGDLELSHGPDVSLQGSIYAGGSIYLGSGTQVNDWAALAPLNGKTTIGPPNPCPWPGWSSGGTYVVGSLVQHSSRFFQCTAAHTGSAVSEPGGTGTAWRAYWVECTKVKVTGLDGIYRLSKAALYGSFNSFPMVGAPPSGFTVNGSYHLEDLDFPGEKGAGASFRRPDTATWGGDVFNATFQGTLLNPARVTDALASRALVLPDDKRMIMGVTLRGVPSGGKVANDSRDFDRTDFSWKTDSLGPTDPGFDKLVRSTENGGTETELARSFQGRPAEAQQLKYDDLDGDITTEEHEFARPLFLDTDPYSPLLGIEKPGTWLKKALGGDFAMRRLNPSGGAPMTGWEVVTKDGSLVTGTPANAGLIIRERPVPQMAYFNPASPTDPASPTYMPYAYGKHNRPSVWPFVASYVTALHGYNNTAGLYNGTRNLLTGAYNHFDLNQSQQTYLDGGTVTVRTACAAGPKDSGGNGTDSTSNPHTQSWGDGTSGYNRFPHFFRENWRFINLKAPVPDTALNGVQAFYFDDRCSNDSGAGDWPNGNFAGKGLRFRVTAQGSGYTSAPTVTLTNTQGSPASGAAYVPASGLSAGKVVGISADPSKFSSAPTMRPSVAIGGPGSGAAAVASMDITGDPAFSRIEPSLNLVWSTGRPTGTGVPVDTRDFASSFWSVRLQGFLYPTATGLHSFAVNCNRGVRVWIDGQRVIDDWGKSSGTASLTNGLTQLNLSAGRAYYIVVEARQVSGSWTLDLRWQPPASTMASIPASALRPPVTDVASPNYFAFRKGEIQSVEVRVANVSGPSFQKVGLMLRDAAGLPVLLDGRDPYAAVLYSPDRGFFAQHRLARARNDYRTQSLYFIGDGTVNYPPLTNADPQGQITVAPTDARVSRKGTITPSLVSSVLGTATTTSGATNTDSTSGPTTTSNPFSVSEGSADAVKWGTITKTRSRQPTKRTTQRFTVSWNFALGNCSQPTSQVFDTANDDASGDRIYFYGTTIPDSTTTAVTSFTNNNYWFVNSTNFRRNYTNTADSGNVNWGNPVTQSTTYGTARTIWDPLPKIYSGSTYIRTLSAAETIAAMNQKYGVSDFTYGGSTSVAYPNPSVTYNSGSPTVTAPTAPAGWTYGTTPRSFSIQRGTSAITYDHNSFVATQGTWFPNYLTGGVPVPATGLPAGQCLPWASTATAWTSTSWNLTMLPETGAFQPNVWSAGTIPAFTAPNTVPPAVSVVGTPRWTGDQPASWSSAVAAGYPHIWLRMERDTSTYPGRTVMRLKYYAGTTAPASSAAYTLLKDVDITDLAEDLQLGLVVQSGHRSYASTARFSDIKVQYAAGLNRSPVAPADLLDYRDWEYAAGAGGTSELSKYMCSQYQVFWGNYDITEDFFTCQDLFPAQYPARLAAEDWILNPREFWSQGQWWATGEEKDPGFRLPTALAPSTNREVWAKSTLLTLDMRAVQDYIKNRTLEEATGDRIPGIDPGGYRPASAPAVVLGTTAPAAPSGLIIYAARTNRYPWNPNLNGPNPWNPALPNGTSSFYTNDSLAQVPNVAPGYERAAEFRTITGVQNLVNTVQFLPTKISDPASPIADLNAYAQDLSGTQGALSRTPAIKPQDFHHGVRLRNGASIDWGLAGVPNFGASKLLVVSPSALYLQGDFNTTAHAFTYQGTTVHKVSPVGVFGDSITLLSNSWDESAFRQPGLTANASAVTGGGTLALGQVGALPAASDTSYYAAFLTHNLPTSKQRVLDGEAASFINTMLYLEDWAGKSMNYMGSLVVMDSRRYTRGFLLESQKSSGPSPLGFMGWNRTWSYRAPLPWSPMTGDNQAPPATAHWSGVVHAIYGAPNRNFAYNYDFLSKEGTPPEIPFGVKAAGVGGWIRVVQ